MSIFNCKSKNIAEIDKKLTDKESVSEEHTEREERVIRKIIYGKLYDTSKAEKICSIVVPDSEIPEYGSYFRTLCGQEVIIYKGITEFFIVYCGCLNMVSETWVRKWLGEKNIDKYIELFGEPELA